MLKNRRLNLVVSRIPGESTRNFNYRRAETLFGDESPKAIEPQKLFADLLKRQARAAMAAVSGDGYEMPGAFCREESEVVL